eukprot:9915608-Karenia_brevis.AAC.1
MQPSKHIWCRGCARSVAGCRWNCLCGKVWHQCSKHFSTPLPSVTEPALSPTPPQSMSSSRQRRQHDARPSTPTSSADP